MKKITETAEKNALKEFYLYRLMNLLELDGEDVGVVGSGTFNFPCVGSEGGEYAIKVTLSIPTGSRNDDGTVEPYDYAEEREAYEFKCKETAEKKAKIAETKEKKKAIDAENRRKKKEMLDKQKGE